MTRRLRWRAAIVAAAVGAGSVAAGPAAAGPVPPPMPVLPGEPPPGWPAAPPVDAPVVLLVEAETGQVLASTRADRRRAVASTIKLLTALTVVHRADLDEEVTIDAAAAAIGGSSVELEAGDEWTVEQLLLGLLVRSGNDAAEALATHVGGGDPGDFVDLMAADAAALGLPVGPGGIELTSPSGLGDGNRLSAEDLAVLARAALADPVLRPMLAAEEVTLPGIGEVENRNELLGAEPGVTGVKTGFTEAAGNSLIGSALREGRELVVVVLGGGPDPERFVDAATLLDHGFDAFRPETLDAELTLLVAGGTTTVTVPPTGITVPTAAQARLELPVPTRPPESDELEVPLTVDGDTLTVVPATVTDAELVGEGSASTTDSSGASAVGRAVVDGVHVALRAAHAEDTLGAASGGAGSR